MRVDMWFFFKQKAANEVPMRDWSSYVCSSELLDYPASALPAGAFTTTAQLTTEQRVALNRSEANEPVLLSKLSGKGGRASISALLDPDKRAAAVRVNDMTGEIGRAHV